MSSNTFVLPQVVSTLSQSRLDYNQALTSVLQNFASAGQPTAADINLIDVSGPQQGMLWYKAGSNTADGQGQLYVYDGSQYTRNGIATYTMPNVVSANQAASNGKIAYGQLVVIPGDSGSRLYMVNSAGTGVVDVGIPPAGYTISNAELLDGIDSSSFLRSDAADSFSETITGTAMLKLANTTTNSNTVGALWLSGSSGALLVDNQGNKRLSWNDGGSCFSLKSGVYYSSGDKYVRSGDGATQICQFTDGVAGNVRIRVADTGAAGATPVWLQTFVFSNTGLTVNSNTFWHAGNDGAGSGLDADLLDGVQLSSIQSDYRANLFNTYTTLSAVDVANLATARGNDHATLLSARANDYATYTTLSNADTTNLATARGNDYATLLSARANDWSTYSTITSNLFNTYTTLNNADATNLATARGNDHATLLSARANDYATYTTLNNADATNLATARGNDHVTLYTALANDYNSWTTVSGLIDLNTDTLTANTYSTYALLSGNDHATLMSARSNDGATLLTARSNDYNTLLSARSNDGATLATARGNDHSTLLSARSNDYATFTTLDSSKIDKTAVSITNTSNLNNIADGLYSWTAGTGAPLNAPGTYMAMLQTNAGGNFVQLAVGTADTYSDIYTRRGATSWVRYWNDGNDGSGSGLDADVLDGQQGSYYLDWTNTTNKPSPVLTLGGDATGNVTFSSLSNATLTVTVVNDSHTHSFNNLTGKTGGTGNYTTTGTFTAATFNATSTTDGGFQGIETDSNTSPSFTWTGDLNTGMWRPAADQIGFTSGGINKVLISSIGLQVTDGNLYVPEYIYHTSDTNTYFRFPSNDTISMATNGTDRLTIGSTGLVSVASNIAINATTTSSNNVSKYFITGTGSDRVGDNAGNYIYPAEFQFGATTNTQRLQVAGYRRDASTTWHGTAYRLQYAVDNSFTDGSKAYVEIGSRTSGSGSGFVALGTTGSDRLYINSTGNVGIGTSSPSVNLDVAGRIYAKGVSAFSSAFTAYSDNSAANWSAISLVNTNATDGFLLYQDQTGKSTIRNNNNGSDIEFNTKTGGSSGERMRITSAGNVGIGTSSPITSLHIESNPAYITLRDTDAPSNGYFQIGAIGGAGQGAIISVDPNNVSTDSYLGFNMDGSERLRITSTGNVGIGTSSPSRTLDVAGEAAVDDNLLISRSSVAPALQFSNANYGGSNGSINYYDSGSLVFFTNAIEKMRITSTGNVGIGTSSPTVPLDVNGAIIGRSTATVQGTFNVEDVINYNGSSVFYIRSRLNGGNVQIGTESTGGTLYYPIVINGTSDYTAFSNQAGEAVRITSTGNVGIGTASPQALLDVSGSNVSSLSLQLRSGDTGNGTDSSQIVMSYNGSPYNSAGYAHAIKTRHSGATNTNNAIDFWLWSNTANGGNSSTLGNNRVMTIEGTGYVGIGTASPSTTLDVNGEVTAVDYNTTSDITVKENICKIDEALHKVQQLNGITFNFVDDETKTRHAGVIAQEVEAVLPEAVKELGGIKHVAYGNLIGLLVEAIKEQQKQIDELKSLKNI